MLTARGGLNVWTTVECTASKTLTFLFSESMPDKILYCISRACVAGRARDGRLSVTFRLYVAVVSSSLK